MFCPACGLERVSPDTAYCSRCGFLLTGVMQLIDAGGVVPQNTGPIGPVRRSARSRGVRQGLFIFLLTFLLVPLVAIVSLALQVREPVAVAITAILFSVGGILRMLYAWLFEDPGASSGDDFLAVAQRNLRGSGVAALPDRSQPSAREYAEPRPSSWRDTNDLQPTSVTENTTRLLEDEDQFR